MAPEIESELLERVPMNRRAFVKKVVLGTAFAVPAIASFEMRSLDAFAADCIAPNQTAVLNDGRFSVELLDTDAITQSLKLRIKVRDADTDENISSKRRHVRLRKIDPEPARGKPNLPVDFDFKRSGRLYQLKLDTSRWEDGAYRLIFTIGKDPTKFSVVMLVGGC